VRIQWNGNDDDDAEQTFLQKLVVCQLSTDHEHYCGCESRHHIELQHQSQLPNQ
jgi:hypothetical protein